MAVPWDRPYIPKLAVGSITDDEIYLSVGKAISAWESVEASYASIFAGFTSQHGIDHQPAVRAFGVVTTVMTRRHMIEAAADAFFRQYDEISDLRPSMEDHQAELKVCSNYIKDGPRAEMMLRMGSLQKQSSFETKMLGLSRTSRCFFWCLPLARQESG